MSTTSPAAVRDAMIAAIKARYNQVRVSSRTDTVGFEVTARRPNGSRARVSIDDAGAPSYEVYLLDHWFPTSEHGFDYYLFTLNSI